MRMDDLRLRTKKYALRIIRLFSALPRHTVAQVLGKQVLRSGTSVAANLREASRARSDAEFTSKLGIVEQELDESMLWLELLEESGTLTHTQVGELHDESEQLLKIIVSSIKTSKSKKTPKR